MPRPNLLFLPASSNAPSMKERLKTRFSWVTFDSPRSCHTACA